MQVKFDMVKYVRVNINNLEISEIKWMRHHNLIQMATIFSPVGKAPFRRNGVAP